jgi:Skp family chaperone for outer membrane proteins
MARDRIDQRAVDLSSRTLAHRLVMDDGRNHRKSHILNKGASMRASTIVAVAFLFVFVGVQRVAQADEVKAKMEEIKGETNAKIEETKGEAKALTEEAKGNKMQAAMERAKGKTKAAGERMKGTAKQLKAKTE